MVSLRDLCKGFVGDLQRSGMKRSRLESPGEKDRKVIPDPIDDRELPGMNLERMGFFLA